MLYVITNDDEFYEITIDSQKKLNNIETNFTDWPNYQRFMKIINNSN
jgi:hypothetical protein